MVAKDPLTIEQAASAAPQPGTCFGFAALLYSKPTSEKACVSNEDIEAAGHECSESCNQVVNVSADDLGYGAAEPDEPQHNKEHGTSESRQARKDYWKAKLAGKAPDGHDHPHVLNSDQPFLTSRESRRYQRSVSIGF
jgi:hypothetical protein